MTSAKTGTWVIPPNYVDGWDEFRLPITQDLVNKEIRVRFDKDDRAVVYTIYDSSSLGWVVENGPDAGLKDTEQCDMSRITEDVYFVDFVKRSDPSKSVSLILDFGTSRVLSVTATMPDLTIGRSGYYERLSNGIDLSCMQVEYMHGVMASSTSGSAIVAHERTTDLLGKWMQYQYTNHHLYEHIYITATHMAWHCLKGTDEGLADTDLCDYWKLGNDLYAIVWRETVYPICGLSIINLRNMRTMGKQFGLNIVSGDVIRVVMGSYARVVGGRLR